MLRTVSFFIILIFSNFFSVGQAIAIEVKGLYQAKIIVENQSEKVRQKALQAAMSTVITKVSGRKDTSNQPVFSHQLRYASKYLIQYHYEKIEEQLFLIVEFDSEKINRLFKETNTPIWGSLRPKILLWIVNEQGLSREILSNDDNNIFIDYFSSYSQKRGLPLYLPLMDLEDANSIHAAELWGRFDEPVEQASSRYFAEKIVIVRISDNTLVDLAVDESNTDIVDCGLLCDNTEEKSKVVALDWSLIGKQQMISQPYQGGDYHQLVEDVVDDIIEQIYQQYAFYSNNSNQLTIEINHIHSLVHYVEATSFLSNLASVNSIILEKVQAQRYFFTLSISGSIESLLSSLELSKQLKQTIDPLADPLKNEFPQFSWQGK